VGAKKIKKRLEEHIQPVTGVTPRNDEELARSRLNVARGSPPLFACYSVRGIPCLQRPHSLPSHARTSTILRVSMVKRGRDARVREDRDKEELKGISVRREGKAHVTARQVGLASRALTWKCGTGIRSRRRLSATARGEKGMPS
jgi:hypothetical protein